MASDDRADTEINPPHTQGRRVSNQARRGKLGGLFAALKRRLQRADDDTWLQTNRCPRCRGLGRVPCAACGGLGMRVMRGAK
jgi:hypothetical protein